MHWLNNGCYPGYVMFSCGFNYAEIVTLLKRKKAHDWLLPISQKSDKELIESGSYFALLRTTVNPKTGEKVRYLYIILTKCFEFTDQEYCTLAHEVLHITNFFLREILDRDNEMEAEAYYHTHIMEQCLEVLRGKTK